MNKGDTCGESLRGLNTLLQIGASEEGNGQVMKMWVVKDAEKAGIILLEDLEIPERLG